MTRIPLTKLHAAPWNPRTIKDERFQNLCRSIEADPGLLDLRPILATTSGEIYAGNMRFRAVAHLGWTDVPAELSDIPEQLAKERALRDNNQFGDWADDDLGTLLAELKDAGSDIDLLGFDSPELDRLLAGVQQIPEEDEADLVPPVEPVTKPGDLWLLGEHRLIAGDCRDLATVTRLLDGQKINVAVTSPPYASQRTYDESSGFTPIPPEQYGEWYRDVAANIMANLADDGSYFLNIKEHCEDGQRHLYVKDLTIAHVREWGWRFVDEFCWRDTKNGVPGGWNNRFKDAWEPVFQFSKSSGIKFRPDGVSRVSGQVFDYSAQTAKTKTGSGLLGVKAVEMHAGIARPSNVLEIAAASSGGHSAAFPVDLPAFFIQAFSDRGDIVYDPFMGSGTTLIAAEQTGRQAFGCEISPGYCDVIVNRWQKLTGKTAVLASVPELVST